MIIHPRFCYVDYFNFLPRSRRVASQESMLEKYFLDVILVALYLHLVSLGRHQYSNCCFFTDNYRFQAKRFTGISNSFNGSPGWVTFNSDSTLEFVKVLCYALRRFNLSDSSRSRTLHRVDVFFRPSSSWQNVLIEFCFAILKNRLPYTRVAGVA